MKHPARFPRWLPVALLVASPGAHADVFSADAGEGWLVVDGRWIDAPAPIVYSPSTPGIFVANVPVAADTALVRLLGVQAIPDLIELESARAFDGRRRVPPAEPLVRRALDGLVRRMETFLLERIRNGSDAAAIRRDLGHFLLDAPDVVGAEVGSDVVRIDASLDETWALELPAPDDRRIEGVVRHVGGLVESVREAAADHAIYEDGVRYVIERPATRRLVDALLAAGEAPGAAAWNVRVWGDAVGVDVAARALHARLAARSGREAAESALIAPYPSGPDGVWVLPDTKGLVALACRDVELVRLVTRIERVTGANVDVAFADRERRVTYYADGFAPLDTLLDALASACALSVTHAPDGAHTFRDAAPMDPMDLPAEGQPLWHVASLATSASWLATTTSVVVAPVRLGGVRAHHWRTGGVAWQLPGERAPFPACADDEGRLALSDATGMLAVVRYTDGRARWARYPALDLPTIGNRPAFRVLAAGERQLLAAERDRWVRYLHPGDGDETARLAISRASAPQDLDDDAVVFTIDGAIVAADPEEPRLLGAVRGAYTTAARVQRIRDGWAVEEPGAVVRLDAALTVRARVPLGPTRAWAASGDVLIVGGTGAEALVRRGDRWEGVSRVTLPARPTAAFVVDGRLYVACADGNGYRVDPDRAAAVARLDGLDVPPRVPVAVHGVALFFPTYGGALAGYRVR